MYRFCSLLILGVGALSRCTTAQVLVAHAVDLVPAELTIPEDQLLDVGILTFDPGVPEGEVDEKVAEELLEEGTFVSIRRTESLYMAVRLRDALQQTGHWGAVWVTPKESTAADVKVAARILHSDGDFVEVRVKGVDASGAAWIGESYQGVSAA